MILNSAHADRVIIVGSGLAGLTCALELAPRPVTLITKTLGLDGGCSILAKGGIAVAIGPGDTPGDHAADTVAAGAGLSDPKSALQLAEDGAESLQFLLDGGAAFDRVPGGKLQLAQEAAHCFPRIVHAGGDATGETIMKSLVERVCATPSIDVLENTLAHDLVVHDQSVHGIVAYGADGVFTFYQASQVVMATGGIGMAWWHTTNPREATGDGLAMAARAGAHLTDLEFVQFHPTALDLHGENNGASLPLLTEALRGAGALLLDKSGQRFMFSVHPAAELAPRDVVARAIEKRTADGQCVFLDMRPLFKERRAHLFPQALKAAEEAGIDAAKAPVPVIPAAHYHMGGIQTDHRGHTSIGGLWACGEVATTGIHGANRLASNSLLEALVYARRIAAKISGCSVPPHEHPAPIPATPRIPPDTAIVQMNCIVNATRKIMSHNVGVMRSGDGLVTALSQLSELNNRMRSSTDEKTSRYTPSENVVRVWSEARNILVVARLVTLAALRREESRGAHFRVDYPRPVSEWKRRQSLTVDQLNVA